MSKDNDKKFDGLFDLAIENVNKKSKFLYDLEQAEEVYGVRDYLSTGLADWDLHLHHNEERTKYGLPYGRIIELCGESGACKTTEVLSLLTRNATNGGYGLYITSEGDFDLKYVYNFAKQNGTTEEQLKRIKVGMATSVSDFHHQVDEFLKPYDEYFDQISGKKGVDLRKDFPKILIVLDSFGALMGDENRVRAGEDFDQGDRMGGRAGEAHKFFQYHVARLCKLGAMFVFTNHFRASMSSYGSPRKPAYDSSTKYYCTVRCDMVGYAPSNLGTKKVNNKEANVGFPVKIRIRKSRTDNVLTGEVEAYFINNYGFDVTRSIVSAAIMSDVFRVPARSRSYEFNFDDDSPLAKWFEAGGSMQKKKCVNMVNDDPELAATLTMECFKRGPDTLDDTRGTERV